MEAAEFAIRLARVVTRKNGVVGFEKSMHGKSLATAYLGWDNKDDVFLPYFHRLPFVQSCSEEEILRRLKEVLTGNPVSALFIEPLQGSGGGHMASKRFYEEVSSLCRAHDVLLVFDEILTGFYRTGPPFFFSEMGFVPDIILIGKALGNGFPVSGVVVDRKYPIVRDMLPGSTYAGNPLASAAVLATLGQIRSMNLPGRVELIEKTITGCLGPLAEIDIPVRGKGALWIVEVPATLDVEEIVWNIYSAGVCVGYTGHQIRILPAATITMTNLERACAVVTEEVMKAHHG
jgi:acetylornithine/succinyldiaminopimelate/putrescine aminotransferase